MMGKKTQEEKHLEKMTQAMEEKMKKLEAAETLEDMGRILQEETGYGSLAEFLQMGNENQEEMQDLLTKMTYVQQAMSVFTEHCDVDAEYMELFRPFMALPPVPSPKDAKVLEDLYEKTQKFAASHGLEDLVEKAVADAAANGETLNLWDPDDEEISEEDKDQFIRHLLITEAKEVRDSTMDGLEALRGKLSIKDYAQSQLIAVDLFFQMSAVFADERPLEELQGALHELKKYRDQVQELAAEMAHKHRK